MSPDQPDSIVKGLKSVAAHFGKSLRQVQRWALAPDFPRLSGRRFDLLQIQGWLDRRDGRPPRSAAAAGDPRQRELSPEASGDGKEHWDSQGKKFQALTRELEYRRLLGELVERRAVEDLFVARIMAVKQGLLTFSRSLPPQLIHCQEERDMEALIAAAARALLEDFARALPEAIGTTAPPAEVPPMTQGAQ